MPFCEEGGVALYVPFALGFRPANNSPLQALKCKFINGVIPGKNDERTSERKMIESVSSVWDWEGHEESLAPYPDWIPSKGSSQLKVSPRSRSCCLAQSRCIRGHAREFIRFFVLQATVTAMPNPTRFKGDQSGSKVFFCLRYQMMRRVDLWAVPTLLFFFVKYLCRERERNGDLEQIHPYGASTSV